MGKYEEAHGIFQSTGINLTTEGCKYLGCFVGTKVGSEKYVINLQERWVEEFDVLKPGWQYKKHMQSSQWVLTQNDIKCELYQISKMY